MGNDAAEQQNQSEQCTAQASQGRRSLQHPVFLTHITVPEPVCHKHADEGLQAHGEEHQVAHIQTLDMLKACQQEHKTTTT